MLIPKSADYRWKLTLNIIDHFRLHHKAIPNTGHAGVQVWKKKGIKHAQIAKEERHITRIFETTSVWTLNISEQESTSEIVDSVSIDLCEHSV